MGLYRDDGLIIKEPNGPKLDKYRKKINSLKLQGFKITIKTNLKITNFLSVTLNLEKGTFKPFKKENDTPIYIHTSSNHSPSIIKQIPISICYRQSDKIKVFNIKKNIYNNAQKKKKKKCGYTQQEYTPLKAKPKNRKRNNLVQPTL